MDEQKMPRRPRRSSTEEQPKNESLRPGRRKKLQKSPCACRRPALRRS